MVIFVRIAWQLLYTRDNRCIVSVPIQPGMYTILIQRGTMIIYSGEAGNIPHALYAMWGNPFGFRHSVEREQLLDEMNKQNSGKGPGREPGFSFTSAFVIIFIVICCFAGMAVGDKLDGPRGALFGLIAGLIIGRIAGTILAKFLDNLRAKGWRLSSKREHEEKDWENSQGPFIR